MEERSLNEKPAQHNKQQGGLGTGMAVNHAQTRSCLLGIFYILLLSFGASLLPGYSHAISDAHPPTTAALLTSQFNQFTILIKLPSLLWTIIIAIILISLFLFRNRKCDEWVWITFSMLVIPIIAAERKMAKERRQTYAWLWHILMLAVLCSFLNNRKYTRGKSNLSQIIVPKAMLIMRNAVIVGVALCIYQCISSVSALKYKVNGFGGSMFQFVYCFFTHSCNLVALFATGIVVVLWQCNISNLSFLRIALKRCVKQHTRSILFGALFCTVIRTIVTASTHNNRNTAVVVSLKTLQYLFIIFSQYVTISVAFTGQSSISSVACACQAIFNNPGIFAIGNIAISFYFNLFAFTWISTQASLYAKARTYPTTFLLINGFLSQCVFFIQLIASSFSPVLLFYCIDRRLGKRRDLSDFKGELTQISLNLEGYMEKCGAVQRLTQMEVKKIDEIRLQYKIDTGQSLTNLWKHRTVLKGILEDSFPDEGTDNKSINNMLKAVERITPIEQKLKERTNLWIINRQRLSDEGARAIVLAFPYLQNLEISSNHITDEGAMVIARKLPHLTRLALCKNNHIADEGVRAIAQALPNLTELRIGFNQVTREGARAIARGLPRLRQLGIQSTQFVRFQVSPFHKRLYRRMFPNTYIY